MILCGLCHLVHFLVILNKLKKPLLHRRGEVLQEVQRAIGSVLSVCLVRAAYAQHSEDLRGSRSERYTVAYLCFGWHSRGGEDRRMLCPDDIATNILQPDSFLANYCPFPLQRLER
jgi:hypothetical protein